MTHVRAPLLVAALAAAFVFSAGAPSEGRLQPAASPSLLERVRANLARDDERQALVGYLLKRRSYEVSGLGKLENGDERVYEHIPSADEPSGYYRRLIAVNGRPLSPEQVRVREEERRRNAAERQRARSAETAGQRATRLREEAENRRQQQARLDDAFGVFSYHVRGHEFVDGAMRLAIGLAPRPDAPTHSDIGRHLKKLKGTAWVDEDAGELVRLEMEAFDTISLGLGFIGRLQPGSRGVYRRAPVAEGWWMPVEVRFHGAGRTLLFRSFAIDTYALYSDFRRSGTPRSR